MNNKLICYSIIKDLPCKWGNNCTYAHNRKEQTIYDDRLKIYVKILSDKIDDVTDNEYKLMMFLTNLCDNCVRSKCAGEYNCRNGANDKFLKVCNNDLITGDCMNKIINIEKNDEITNKIKINTNVNYIGCVNGHHLTSRGLLCYQKYLSNSYSQLENFTELSLSETSSLSDEEISALFKK